MNLFLLVFVCLNIFTCRYNNQIEGAIDSGYESDDKSFEEGLRRSRYRQREKNYEATHVTLMYDSLPTLNTKGAEIQSNENYNQTEDEDRFKSGLLIFGFDANVNDENDIRECVLRIFNDIMRLGLKNDDVVAVWKLGNDITYRRPVFVQLSDTGLKDLIILHRRRLRGLRYKIENYLTRHQLTQQKKLIPLMRYFRKLGRYAIIREGLLVVDGRVVENVEYLSEQLRLGQGLPTPKPTVATSNRFYYVENRTDNRLIELYDDLIESHDIISDV